MQPHTLAFIGAGRLGQALATLLAGRGHHIAAAYSRTRASARSLCDRAGGRVAATAAAAAVAANVVIIATPDDAIAAATAAAAAGGGFRPGQVVLHLSGALDAAVLAPARMAGAATGSMHPLASIPTPEAGIAHLAQTRWGLEGDDDAVATATALLTDLGATTWRLQPGTRTLYHAGAVLACNYLVTLMDLAIRTWGAAGIDPDEALTGLLPLVRGTVDNLGRLGLPGALTGPIARGDVETLHRHLQALTVALPEVAEAYRCLGCNTVPVAAAAGLHPAMVAELTRLLAPGSRTPEA